jgi:FtsP/CotA-like multicopper oxidase with cupredoxin domain
MLILKIQFFTVSGNLMKITIHIYIFLFCSIFIGKLNAEENFASPPDVRSVNGFLNLDLHVSIDTVEIDGRKIFTRLYNGLSTGPTFRVKPGDVLRVKLINDMPPSPDDGEMMKTHNFPNTINRTNLHTHGLFVSSKDSSDNPFIEVKSGESFQYHIKIPDSHQEGTNWYHPHRHGSIWAQMAAGLAGAIVIEGVTDEVPEIKAAEEHVMVIQSFTFDKNYNFPYPNPDATTFGGIFPGADSTIFTLNGKTSGKITMKPGEIQRWRFVNAHLSNQVYVTVWQNEKNIPLYRYAVDGVNLMEPGYMDSVLLAVGNRADMLFKAPLEPGKYTLRLTDVEPFSLEVTNHDIIEIDVTGDSNDMQMPSSIPFPERLKLITDDEITNNRTMTFSIQSKESPFNIFFIDDKVFDPDHSDVVVKVGDVEEWTLVNESTEVHPFHIHINDFLVTEINGVKQVPPVWWDVMNIPTKGSLKFRTRFEEFDGKTVLHCHNIVHEDLGMMQVVEILPKNTSVDDNNPIDLKAAYPNPVVGNLQNINFNLPEFLQNKPINIEVFDILGTKLLDKNIIGASENQLSIDVSGYTKGSYYYKVSSGNYNNTNKFIILK